MIERYSTPDMTAIWSDESKLTVWTQIEIIALRMMSNSGLIPSLNIPTVTIADTDEIMLEIKGNCSQAVRIPIHVFKDEWLEEENNTHHDVVAFIHVLEHKLGEIGKYIHYGMTSSDLCDTEFALRLKYSITIIKDSLAYLQNAIMDKASKYIESPIIGRTHGMWAEPTSFGLVLSSYVEEINRHIDRLNSVENRACVGKLSGAVGTYAHTNPTIEEDVMRELCLNYETVASQVVHRDRHAELFNCLAMIAATIERLAIEIRHLSRSEIKEVAEPFGKNQKGSSAMPHKKNPIKSENLTGLARVIRANAGAAMENIALWHQRDISHSSVERIIAPDSFELLHFMIDRMTSIIKDLIVDEDAMRRRVYESLPYWRSQMYMLQSIQNGLSRKEAHDWAQNQENLPPIKLDEEKLVNHHLRFAHQIFERIS